MDYGEAYWKVHTTNESDDKAPDQDKQDKGKDEPGDTADEYACNHNHDHLSYSNRDQDETQPSAVSKQ